MSVMSDDPPRRSLVARLKGAIHRRPVPELAMPTPENGGAANGGADGPYCGHRAHLQGRCAGHFACRRRDGAARPTLSPLILTRRWARWPALSARGASHSRLPLYRETLDDPVGVVHIKDVMAHLAGDETGKRPEDWALAKILPQVRRPLLYVPALHARGRPAGAHAVAAHAHGAGGWMSMAARTGWWTLEDLLEPIVGEIDDEHDENEGPLIRARGPNIWEADARIPL